MENALRVVLAAQYTGTPASTADVLAMCQQITQFSGNAWTVESDDGNALVLRETNPAGPWALWPVALNQYVIVAPDTGIINRMTPAAYAARYKAVDSVIAAQVQAAIPAIAASAPVQAAITAAVGQAMFGGFGVAALPALLGGQTSAPIPITIDPAQPSTGYVARAFAVSGVAVLATVQIVSLTKTSGSVCTVVVKNNGLITLAGLLLVHVTPPVS